jgi:hypothetical protein
MEEKPMQKKKWKQYPAEFKAKVVKELRKDRLVIGGREVKTLRVTHCSSSNRFSILQNL